MSEIDGHRIAKASALKLSAYAAGLSLCIGFLVLPGLVFGEAGPAVLMVFVLAALVVLLCLFSASELSSAMPDEHQITRMIVRASGPFPGTVGGISIWFWYLITGVLALHGATAHLDRLVPVLAAYPVGLVLILILGIAVYLGTGTRAIFRHSFSALVFVLVIGVFVIGWRTLSNGLPGTSVDLSTAGLAGAIGIALSGYAGLIVAGVHSDGRKTPGLVVTLVGFTVIFVTGALFVMMVLPGGQITDGLTTIAASVSLLSTSAVASAVYTAGVVVLSVAAGTFLGLASREWLSMSRQKLIPLFPGKSGSRIQIGWSVSATALGAGVLFQFVDALLAARLAGAFLLLVMAAICLSVVVLRESHVDWYAPYSPVWLYPLPQVISLILIAVLFFQFAPVVLVFLVAVPLAGASAYWLYGAERAEPGGAIYHWLARLGEQQYAGLDRELRGILKEKGLREEDPFDEIVARSRVIEAVPEDTFETVVRRAAEQFASVIDRPAAWITDSFLEGTRIGATPVTHGVALPHFRIAGLSHPEMVLVRSRSGLAVVSNDPIIGHEEQQDVNAVFFLVSAEDNPGQHLRILAQIAGRVDDDGFMGEWLEAGDEADLKEVLLRDDRFMSLYVRRDSQSASLIDISVRDIDIPEGCLIAMVRREGSILVPRGKTVILEGDRLTIIGDAQGLSDIRSRFGGGNRRTTKKK